MADYRHQSSTTGTAVFFRCDVTQRSSIEAPVAFTVDTFGRLDCLVNNELFAAYQRGEYTEWVVANVGWLVDRPVPPLDKSVVVPVRGVLSRIVADPR